MQPQVAPAPTEPQVQPQYSEPEAAPQQQQQEQQQAAPAATGRYTEGDPFWAVWVGAFKDKANAEERLQAMRDAGYPDPRIYWSADYADLNQDGYWVVAAGIYRDEAGARGHLQAAVDAGYADAYVKYTGAKK